MNARFGANPARGENRVRVDFPTSPPRCAMGPALARSAPSDRTSGQPLPPRHTTPRSHLSPLNRACVTPSQASQQREEQPHRTMRRGQYVGKKNFVAGDLAQRASPAAPPGGYPRKGRNRENNLPAFIVGNQEPGENRKIIVRQIFSGSPPQIGARRHEAGGGKIAVQIRKIIVRKKSSPPPLPKGEVRTEEKKKSPARC